VARGVFSRPPAQRRWGTPPAAPGNPDASGLYPPYLRGNYRARAFARQFGSLPLLEWQERLADMWRYCSCEWLTVRRPGADSNRARWPLQDYWKVVQGAGVNLGEMYGVLRLRQKRVQYDALGLQARGVLVTMVATMATETWAGWGMLMVGHDVGGWFSSAEFMADVEKRMGKLGKLQRGRRVESLEEGSGDGIA